MKEKKHRIDRRRFLCKSASLLCSSLFGLNSFSKVLASEKHSYNSSVGPRIALIIDDIGYSFSRTKQFLSLGIPITFSILPRLAKSHDLSLEIHGKGHEIMLHQPMEPHNADYNPGPGALYVGYEPKRIIRIVEENIAYVPFATGVNNHMGSRLTENRKEINDALSVIKNRGLYFIDSLTSSRSLAYHTAKSLHISTACRNIFIDNIPDESAVLSQLCKLEKHARIYGSAIGIGHPFPETANGVRRFLKGFIKPDVSMVHMSKIL